MSFIEYEVDGRVAVIALNRPERANAQSPTFLRELDAAWTAAAADDDVRVIVVRANGNHFSSGHDFKAPDEYPSYDEGYWAGYGFEAEVFFGFKRKWRDIPKPSIAAVHGVCVAAGLMLAWPCDLIIASEDARFGDPVIRLGVGSGVEYHGHTWELGPRKAKELLFTAAFIDAAEAHRLGMVNRVVPREELDSATMALAREIAEQDPFALRMAKRAVNVTMDIRGFSSALDACFDQHWVGHAHSDALSGRTGEALVDIGVMSRGNRPALAALKEDG
jgi:enoyl-CoA hydratase